MEKDSRALGIASKLYEIIINHQSRKLMLPQIIIPSPSEGSASEKEIIIREQLKRLEEQLAKVRACLQKEKELSYIMKGYFAKIEKIMYNKESHLFEAELDYQKIELHMREIVRRLADFHNQKLNSLPVIYRNPNIKVYKHPSNAQIK